ncbi:zinc ribbon domain-containing protein [Aestuariirhabdus sp. Z084]|uniref:FmdB family zinc ribbon protein n=1 Tax=Aestuariirhabdus haliotis TaxID=2918751 RepID=UPI00201B35A0|nr:zinc ribbon domain-containing protein [Aestuariirhabdus haliotis]MCL6416316.1 zinc ribbon domain-containing protein [Aestuariirhabdus haliotis]MCL6420189.1 zinc ribbon domain-containing protein [Aestuariirhabdus haliotis]
MPIYEYSCAACGESHEAIQKISDQPLTCCPHCEADALSKMISAPGFRLAGGGWYETDFKTGSKKNLAGDNGAKKGSDDMAKA